MSSSFEYFTPLVFYVLFLYFIILAVYLVIRRREIHQRVYVSLRTRDDDRQPLQAPPADLQHPYRIPITTKVEDMVDPSFGKKYRVVLLVTRILSCCYFVIAMIVIIATTSNEGFSWLYLDLWNLVLVMIYFILTTFLSYTALRKESLRYQTRQEMESWSMVSKLFSVAIHMLFEITSVLTLMILFSNWMQWSIRNDYINASTYLAFLTLLLELLINNIQFRFDQFPSIASLLMLYYFVLWPAAFNGYLSRWPYSFLAMDTNQCFANYTLVFVAAWVCSFVWYVVFKSKHAMGELYQQRSYEQEDQANIHMATIVTNEVEDELERNSIADMSSVSGSSMASGYHPSGGYGPTHAIPPPYAGFVPSNPYLPNIPPPMSQMPTGPVPMLPPPPSQHFRGGIPPPGGDGGRFPPNPMAPPPQDNAMAPPPPGFDPLFNPYVRGGGVPPMQPPPGPMYQQYPPIPPPSIYSNIPPQQPMYPNDAAPFSNPYIQQSNQFPAQTNPPFINPPQFHEQMPSEIYDNSTLSPMELNSPMDPTYVNTLRNQFLAGEAALQEDGSNEKADPSQQDTSSTFEGSKPVGVLKGGLKKKSGRSINAGGARTISFGADEVFDEMQKSDGSSRGTEAKPAAVPVESDQSFNDSM